MIIHELRIVDYLNVRRTEQGITITYSLTGAFPGHIHLRSDLSWFTNYGMDVYDIDSTYNPNKYTHIHTHAGTQTHYSK